MIAATFKIVSKTQNLNKATIEKLFDCIGDLKSILTKFKFIKDLDKLNLTIQVFKSWIPTQPDLIEKNFVDSINLIFKSYFPNDEIPLPFYFNEYRI